mgnify:CR=1 FL=1
MRSYCRLSGSSRAQTAPGGAVSAALDPARERLTSVMDWARWREVVVVVGGTAGTPPPLGLPADGLRPPSSRVVCRASCAFIASVSDCEVASLVGHSGVG